MIYKKKEKVIARQIVGEMFLVPIRGCLADMEKLYVLDEVGEHIWGALDGVKPVSDLCEGICQFFDVDRAQAERDLTDYLTELQSADLIEEVS